MSASRSSQRPVRWRPPLARRSTPISLPVSIVDLPGTGPEDVLIDRTGAVITGLRNGDVVRVDGDGTALLGNTGGRPLGIEEFPDGNLLVCDHDRGLLRLDTVSGQVEVLLDELDGARLHFCSNAVICADGTIYFSTSSKTANWIEYRKDVIDHATSGRLVQVTPDGAVTVLRDDLAFANGVALPPDESSVLVAETIGYGIAQYWLKGPRAGQWTNFVAGTPGFPDNISLSEDGLVWVSLPSARIPLLDALLPLHPFLRQVVHAIPQWLQPQPENMIWVQAYDLDGNLVHDIKTTHPRLSFVTSVAESGGTLWLGSTQRDVLGRIDLPSPR